MHGFDASRRRTLPEPTGQLRDGRRRTGYDDLDTPVREIFDPAVELQTGGLLGSRGTVVHTLHTAGDDAANRSGQSAAQWSSRARVERNASVARFFARTAFMRAGP